MSWVLAVFLITPGDWFLMNMHHDEFGDYQIRNEVVEYEAGRQLTWEPARAGITRAGVSRAGRPPAARGRCR